MAVLVDEVKEKYHLAISTDYADRAKQTRPMLTAAELYQKALFDNIKEFNDVSVLPYGTASQSSATLPSAVVLQILTSRDATQPLRPCADTTDEEAALNAAGQRTTNHRLLRLLLSDGKIEIPAVELSTLRIFKGIPIPGEKLLLKAGTEVRNGTVIMTDECVVPLGGEVPQLRQEFLAHRRRLELGYQTSSGLEGAPRFQPLQVGQRYNPQQHQQQSMQQQSRGFGQGGRPTQGSRSRGFSGAGGRGGGGRGQDRGRGPEGRESHRGSNRGGGRGSSFANTGYRGRGARADGGSHYQDANAAPVASSRPPVFNLNNFPSLQS